MKPQRVYTRGVLHFFGGIHRSTLLRSSSFKGSVIRIHPRAYAGGLLRRRINLRGRKGDRNYGLQRRFGRFPRLLLI